MDIKLKFKANDTVYLIRNNKIEKDKILFTVISIDRWKNLPVLIEYSLDSEGKDRHNPTLRREDTLFATLEELAKDITNKTIE